MATRKESSGKKRPGKKSSGEKSSRSYGKKASDKVERSSEEMKSGQLRSGGSGKKVTSRQQAIAEVAPACSKPPKCDELPSSKWCALPPETSLRHVSVFAAPRLIDAENLSRSHLARGLL